jgi:hypothetical protein
MESQRIKAMGPELNTTDRKPPEPELGAGAAAPSAAITAPASDSCAIAVFTGRLTPTRVRSDTTSRILFMETGALSVYPPPAYYWQYFIYGSKYLIPLKLS